MGFYDVLDPRLPRRRGHRLRRAVEGRGRRAP